MPRSNGWGRGIMKGRGLAFWLIALGLLIIAPVQSKADDLKIIPSERVGDVTLDMSVDDILKMLGGPSRVDRPATGASAAFEWESRLIRIYQNLNSGQVSEIRTYYVFRRPMSAYRTDKGIGIGSTPGQAVQAYGEAGCFFSDGPTWRNIVWREIGLIAVLRTSPGQPAQIDGRIAEIGVRRSTTSPPGPGNKPCAEMR